jgi:hypothetical protein
MFIVPSHLLEDGHSLESHAHPGAFADSLKISQPIWLVTGAGIHG